MLNLSSVLVERHYGDAFFRVDAQLNIDPLVEWQVDFVSEYLINVLLGKYVHSEGGRRVEPDGEGLVDIYHVVIITAYDRVL